MKFAALTTFLALGLSSVFASENVFDSIQPPKQKVKPLLKDSDYNPEKVLINKDGPQVVYGESNGKPQKTYLDLESVPFESYQEAEANFEAVMARIDEYLLSYEKSKVGHIMFERVWADRVAHSYEAKDGTVYSGCEEYTADMVVYDGLIPSTVEFAYPGTVSAVYSNSKNLKEKTYRWSVMLQYEVRIREVKGVYAYSHPLKKILDGRLLKVR